MACHVGRLLDGCDWVGIPFVGGFSEVPEIKARTIVCSDLHLHIMNLARVVANDALRPLLIRQLRRKAFHPDELRAAQEVCRNYEPANPSGDLALAEAYFVCCWMNRGAKAGTDDEFNGQPSVRWKSDGGDSGVRFQSAIRMLATFSRTLRRCTFETMDCFDFLARCEDRASHGLYVDAPFPGAGRRYRHHPPPGKEVDWHRQLAATLATFSKTRIVCRFYDIPLIRELYSEPEWAWTSLKGRTQANSIAAEVMLMRNGPEKGLF